MKKEYCLCDHKILPCQEDEKPHVLLYIMPDAEETKYLVNDCGIDEYNLQSSLDPDELSRYESDGEHVAIIFKRPRIYKAQDDLTFKAASTGMFLFADRLIVVMDEELDVFNFKQFHRVQSVREVMLKLIFSSIFHFLGHLKVINFISSEIEQKISHSFGNKYLLNLFAIEKSLIYYLNSINSNSSLLERMKMHAPQLGLAENERELLDDIIIENQQCYKQAEIYSNILVGMGDARASIVNNNLSIFMKRLTVITMIFAPLNFFAGVGGMSEFSMMTTGYPWKIAYPLFLVGMVLIAFFTYWWIRRVERRERKK